MDPVRGDCFEVIPRWYFNSRTGSCRRFSYSGCGGNDNNFQAQDECHNVCMKEKSGEEGHQLGERGHDKKHHNHDQTRPGHHGEEQVPEGKYCLNTSYLSISFCMWEPPLRSSPIALMFASSLNFLGHWWGMACTRVNSVTNNIYQNNFVFTSEIV